MAFLLLALQEAQPRLSVLFFSVLFFFRHSVWPCVLFSDPAGRSRELLSGSSVLDMGWCGQA